MWPSDAIPELEIPNPGFTLTLQLDIKPYISIIPLPRAPQLYETIDSLKYHFYYHLLPHLQTH